jgi:hypothetical protein
MTSGRIVSHPSIKNDSSAILGAGRAEAKILATILQRRIVHLARYKLSQGWYTGSTFWGTAKPHHRATFLSTVLSTHGFF